MSLDTLPLEVLRRIALSHALQRPEFISLCLVSKQLVPFARPYLYNFVRLRVSAAYYQEYRDELNPSDSAKYTRDLFFRTITDSPHLASQITALHLIIDPKSLEASWDHRRGKYDITDKIIDLLRKCVNLQQIILETPSGTGDIPFEIIYAIPTSLRILRIVNRPFSPAGWARLLCRLTSLVELDLSRSKPTESPSIRFSVSDTLTSVKLPDEDSKLYPYLTEVVQAVPSLQSLVGPPASLAMIVRNPPRTLKALSIQGYADRTRDPRERFLSKFDRLLSQVVTVLRAARNLEDLSIWFGPGPGPDWEDYDFSLDLIRALPTGVKSLDFRGPGVWCPSSMIDYLNSDDSASLKSIATYRSRGARGEGTNQEIEEICRRREIRLRWEDGWD
ncbi:hypothetical protein JCM5353_004160 [Sporobolomyces roseus]